MAIEVKLPELGDGIKSGDILDVLVREGDTIAKDQSICEIETDKATVPVPSSHAGKVVKIHVQAGQSVAIGAVLLTLEGATAPAAPAPAAAPPAAAPAPAPAAPAAPPVAAAPAAPAPTPQAASPAPAPEPAAPRPAPAPAAPAPQVNSAPVAPVASAPPMGEVTPAGPAIRRLAREVGIDLARVTGTGPGGRILREDVLAAVRRSATGPGGGATAVVDSAPTSSATATEAAPASPSLPSSATHDDHGPIQVERMTKIRRTIATKMAESWSTVPRVTNFDDADITELERIRNASKPDYESRGIKLTTMPFVIKAVALALKSNPALNASIDEIQEQIIYKQYVNIGIAVDTPRGLVVPCLRKPDQLSIPEIARALSSIAENARNNDFKLEDLRGGTFSISNLGAVGGTYSTPIINVPEVAILLLGRSRKMPVVVNDQVAVRFMMPLSLSYDHRLVDGATAARFLNDVKAYLENPSRLLIAP